jgi:HSP20 family protein
MTLVKRNPVNNLDNLFDSFFRDEPMQWMNKQKQYSPAVNIHESDEAFHLAVAAPGFEKGDFKVELNNNELLLKGERKQEETQKEKSYTLREFNHTNFERRFNLPEGKVDDQLVKATYNNGILNIELPKREEHKPAPSRLIDIN